MKMDHIQDPYQAYSETLIAAFERLKKTLNARKFKEVREMCEVAIQQVRSEQDKSDLDANKYFPIFKIALDSKVTKALEHSLYYLQKLISHGFMNGGCPDITMSDPPPTRRLIDAFVDSVCNWVQDRDDSVQLQVIKTILTIVTCFNCEVHNKSLLETFRACFHIHMTSKNAVNQSTAKATLTQMLHVVFQRMESSTSLTEEIGHSDPMETDDSLEHSLRLLMTSLVDDVVLHSHRKLEGPVLHGNFGEVAVENERGNSAGDYGWCINCRQTAVMLSDQHDPVCSLECGQAWRRMCEEGHAASIGFPIPSIGEDANRSHLNDAVMIFRSICKLSLKELQNPMTLYTMKSKVLSLELIYAIIDNPGTIFASRTEFIDIIRQNLWESLIKNSIASDKTIFALSLSIFLSLANNFKDHLKYEIGVFLEQIFFRILESESRDYHHKLLVLQVFYRLTQNAQNTVELFINYDCDVEERDIFARIIEMLARIAQGNRGEQSNPNDTTLRHTSLETLVSIVKSQVAWMDRDREASAVASTYHGSLDMDSEETIGDLSDTQVVDRFERSKLIKTELGRAVAKFNFKPKKGIKYLVDNRYLQDNSAKEIAVFLKTTEGLNKTMIGDYMGEDEVLNKQVMYEFVDLHDFHNIAFVNAIRLFLNSFRLPGESQKIDRMMEKFAEKFCSDNPTVFANADAAYVLAFSIIMLHTDAHNPMVKKKMSLEEFQRINRGINSGSDFDPEFLLEAYNNVKSQEMKLEDDEKLRGKLEHHVPRQRSEIFFKESEKMLQKSQEAFRRSRTKALFFVVKDIDSIRPMFEAIWHSLLAVFSIILEQSDDPKFWNLCLDGYNACMKISSRFQLSLQLESFISSLSKFTGLIAPGANVGDKHGECVSLLIGFAKAEPNYLRNSWRHILKCISRLDYLLSISSGKKTVEIFGGAPPTPSDIQNAELYTINPSELDYIFNISSSLDDDAIVYFVENLIEVSKEEIWSESPRIFSLQALINVADVNMTRIRIVWARIWNCLKEHFSHVCLHPNYQVALFSIDALKQLANKFLQKEELANYNFQKDFLYPFEVIMKKSTVADVRSLVVTWILNLVLALVHNIKSGWASIFEILKLGSKDPNPIIIAESFQAVSRLIDTQLPYISDYLNEIIDCLVSFGKNSVTDISMQAIQFLRKWAGKGMALTQDRIWFSLLKGLADLMLDIREAVQISSLEALFDVLKNTEFTQEQWKMVYSGILVPVFDDIQYCTQETRKTKDEINWIKTTCQNALLALCDLIDSKYSVLHFLITDFVSMLSKAIQAAHEVMAKVALTTLRHLILQSGNKFDEDLWETFSNTFSDLYKLTTPSQLVEEAVDLEAMEQGSQGKLPFDADDCINRCVVQLHLIGVTKEVIDEHFDRIPQNFLMVFLESLESTYKFAQLFNLQVVLRYKLWKDGFMADMKSIPGLLKQEREGLSCYATLLFRLIVVVQANFRETISEKLFSLCRQVLSDYILRQKTIYERSNETGDLSPFQVQIKGIREAETERDIASITPIISGIIIPSLRTLDLMEVKKEMGQILAELIICDNAEIRKQLQELLREMLDVMKPNVEESTSENTLVE